MKSWIVRETGEVRPPKKDEYYYCPNLGGIVSATFDHYKEYYPILSVTPLPTKEEMEKKFNEWEFGFQCKTPYEYFHVKRAFMACYDILFGPQPTPIEWKDDWF